MRVIELSRLLRYKLTTTWPEIICRNGDKALPIKGYEKSLSLNPANSNCGSDKPLFNSTVIISLVSHWGLRQIIALRTADTLFLHFINRVDNFDTGTSSNN